jgi:hypothetical protein
MIDKEKPAKKMTLNLLFKVQYIKTETNNEPQKIRSCIIQYFPKANRQKASIACIPEQDVRILHPKELRCRVAEQQAETNAAKTIEQEQ